MERSNLVIELGRIFAEAKPPMSNVCCIYRVPNDIRELNADAYTPRCISIGPLHHKDQRLQDMEEYKQVYFKKFVAQRKANLKDLVRCVEEYEPTLRQSYSENLDMSKDELVKVILVDACFIAELFYSYKYRNDERTEDATLLNHRLFDHIISDLLLLENQVPFVILEKIFNLAFPCHPLSFLMLSIHFFGHYNRQKLQANFTIPISHFTDLLRTFYLQQPRPGRTESYEKSIRTASAYREAGVKLRINESTKCLLDLQFSGGCLKIPNIKVVDRTEMLFRNMMALEQCHYPRESFITDYVSVMDFLINTDKDVDVLVGKGIMVNWLGDSHDVARMFNSLCKNISMYNFNDQYCDAFDKLDMFCNTRWRKLRATLRRDYCNTPWRSIATVAAIAILFFTLVQAVSSVWQVVLGYKNKPLNVKL